MAALEGFITGFAGKLAEDITKRKDEARDYFNKQVEYARTTGLENRRRVRQTVDANLSIAQQLEAVGVPRELIMAQVNMNPAGLGDFYTTAEKIRAEKQRDLTPEEWKTIFRVSGDFKAPDEDLATFISRTYDPISNAVRSPTFEDDPEGSLFASMMGINAMDRARAELGRTVIADGMTAEELIATGDAQPQRVGGNATVTVDYGALGGKGLDMRELQFLDGIVEEEVNVELDRAVQAGKLVLAEGADATSVRQTVIANISETYPEVPITDIQRLVDAKLRRQGLTASDVLPEEEMPAGGAESPAEGGEAPEMGEGSPETQSPSTEAPTASTEEQRIIRSELLDGLDAAINTPGITESQRTALTAQRESLMFAAQSGAATLDAIADAAALLNRIGARAVEYGIAYPVSTVSPEAGAAVFDYVKSADKASDELARRFEYQRTDPDSAPISPQETNRTTFTAVVDETGKPKEVTLMKDNGDGTSTYIDQEGKTYILPNATIRELVKN